MNTYAFDAKYYTDPKIFAEERANLLAQTWQFACHESMIAKSGDYICFPIAGQDLFCVRGADHRIKCFYNVCQHRAHPLVQDRGNAKVLVCPYHSWTYNLTGELRAGPNLKKVGIDPKTICLTQVACENFHGFIFVNLDDDPAPMDAWYPGVREEWEEYIPQISSLKPVTWFDVQEQCNWKISIENYSECYHCTRNHPTFAKGVIKPETYDIQPQDTGYVLRHTTQCQPLEKMTYAIDTNRKNALAYRAFFLWPMFSLQVYPGNQVNSYHWRELDTMQCSVIRGWYAGEGDDEEVVRNLGQQDFDTTLSEDIVLVENVQRGLQNKGYKPGPLVIDPDGGLNSENSIAKLHAWMRAAHA
ncbi:MAG: aromatic ring-hydroxylating dioxygenase subunit alpha [Pseudomonadota bacterium]